MPNILDNTYFQIGQLYIPNNTYIGARPEGTPTNTDLDTFRTKFERDVLLNSLGVVYYNELQQDLNKLPFNEEATETAADKWINLVNGHTYEYNGNTFIWDGLVGYEKDSLIAYYIKAKFLSFQESTYTTEGIVKLNPSNAYNFDYNNQYHDVWETFTQKYQGGFINKFIRKNNIPNYLLTNRANYSFIDSLIGRKNVLIGRNLYYMNNTPSVSLYEYITDQNDINNSFTDFEFKFYKPSNKMGI